jgi:hypothetical protein
MLSSRAEGKKINEKNLKRKISGHCPFIVLYLLAKTGRVRSADYAVDPDDWSNLPPDPDDGDNSDVQNNNDPDDWSNLPHDPDDDDNSDDPTSTVPPTEPSKEPDVTEEPVTSDVTDDEPDGDDVTDDATDAPTEKPKGKRKIGQKNLRKNKRRRKGRGKVRRVVVVKRPRKKVFVRVPVYLNRGVPAQINHPG